ncbi:MAG: AMP-binding protein [Anaerolineae bacterium]|nr:AMP-binding protein [Anaerolineae bacterium]
MSTLEDRLQHIIHHAYAHAAAVRALFDRAGLTPDDIRTVADLDRIPVTSKDRLAALQAEAPPFGGFLAVPFDRLRHVFLSPGPLYEAHGADSAVVDTVRAALDIAGFTAGDIVLNTFGYHLIPTGLMFDETLRERGATVIPAGVGNADLQVKMMLDLGVTGYVGTPSWLMALLQKAAETVPDLSQRLRLRKVLVSAEPLPPAMRQVFVERYGLRVTNAYGTAELGFLAYNTEGGLAMRLLETGIVQVVNPETGQSVAPGETGEVVGTTFDETYPLIRLGTGDLAMLIDPAPGQSRQGDRSIILVGRVGDAVKVRGMFVHPNQLRFAVGQVPGVTRFQGVVTRPEYRDEFTLRVAAGEEADRPALEQALRQAVQAACRVRLDHIEWVAADAIDDKAGLIVDRRTWT